jgi:hypothetical protein
MVSGSSSDPELFVGLAGTGIPRAGYNQSKIGPAFSEMGRMMPPRMWMNDDFGSKNVLPRVKGGKVRGGWVYSAVDLIGLPRNDRW